MSTNVVSWTREDFDRHALEFEAALTPENVMEKPWVGTQRSMTLGMLEILRLRDPRVQPFNELLVQFEEGEAIKGVVPDNMIVVSEEPQQYENSYAAPLEPVIPLIVIEYVSKGSDKKHYVLNRRRYALVGVPYYVIVDPFKSKLEVHHLQDDGYVRLEPGLNNRVSVPELDLEIGLLNGWMRLWHRGALLPVPAELQQHSDKLQAEKDSLQEANETLVREKKSLQREKTSLQREKDSLQQENRQFVDWLRQSVEAKALKAARVDLLERLPTADLATLQQWMGEL